ncbi:hypothetical protein FOZ63_027782, partial [Perkinsus olseni]
MDAGDLFSGDYGKREKCQSSPQGAQPTMALRMRADEARDSLPPGIQEPLGRDFGKAYQVPVGSNAKDVSIYHLWPAYSPESWARRQLLEQLSRENGGLREAGASEAGIGWKNQLLEIDYDSPSYAAT